MINYIVGKILEKNENQVIVENNGIGYEINCSMITIDALPVIGQEIKLNIFMVVKEDEISLYGFVSKDEKQMFLKLINVSGVGPKVALSILSCLNLNDLSQAILCEDIKLLSTVKGLGKKTAERIILELKDKITPILFDNKFEKITNQSIIEEASEILISLGVNKNEAYQISRKCADDCQTVEEIIRNAFQMIGK